MKRNIFISPIFVTSILLNTFYVLCSSQHEKLKDPRCIVFHVGQMVSRIGGSPLNNNVHGIEAGINSYLGSYASDKIVSLSCSASYSVADSFVDEKRTAVYGFKPKSVDLFGIKDTLANIDIGVGKDIPISNNNNNPEYRKKIENLNYSHIGVGVSLRLMFESAKSKDDTNELGNIKPEIGADENRSALKSFDAYGLGIGLFGNMYYKCNKFMVFTTSNVGVYFFGRADFHFAEQVWGFLSPKDAIDISIKVNQHLGGYHSIKSGILFPVLNDIYYGLVFSFNYNFVADARLREDATSSIALQSDTPSTHNTILPIKKKDEFRHSPSKSIRGSLSLAVIYLNI